MDCEVSTPVDSTPVRRSYPQRNRTKVKYFDEMEDSIVESVKKGKRSKIDDPLYGEEEKETDDEKENEDWSEADEPEEVEEISEYEKLRLRNIEENRRVMMELGLIDFKTEQQQKFDTKRSKVKPPKPAVRRTPKIVQPTKRSLRLLKKTPEGKDIPTDFFESTPIESPIKEEITRMEEEVLPMGENGETLDFLDSLKVSLSQGSNMSCEDSTDSLVSDMRSLEFSLLERLTPSRAHSLCVHPMETKLLVAQGSTAGELGLWDVDGGQLVKFRPHMRPINCVSVSSSDHSKLFTTSHEGTLRRADINNSVFDLVYQSDEKRNMCHLTWHAQVNADTLLVGHGTGETGLVDLRTRGGQRWFHCHQRSVRTVQLHPTQPNYFITSSGIGESKIWDLRGSKKHVDESVGELQFSSGRGLTSAFFSPDGNKVVVTCNDDYIRLYDTSDLANPKETHKVIHDNHTGRWLSVFKAVWHPRNSDLFFIGSMMHPRRMQLYTGSGRLVKEVKSEYLTTVVPVISLHPTLPVVVGSNSSGKAHLFTTPEFLPRFAKPEDDDSA